MKVCDIDVNKHESLLNLTVGSSIMSISVKKTSFDRWKRRVVPQDMLHCSPKLKKKLHLHVV
jgi:hypothetical protein